MYTSVDLTICLQAQSFSSKDSGDDQFYEIQYYVNEE